MELIYDNYTEFLVSTLDIVLKEGKIHNSRNGESKELRDVLVKIKNNRRRDPLIFNRLNNPLATIVETLWVITGNNNVKWLSNFLPRALDYSDDGKIWRNAYGPKLRNWQGKDQLLSVYNELSQNMESRRAVLNIYDAESCLYINSKDIACNLVLNFYVRDNKLHLNVMSRSMDILWGSLVNFYEWSILQEMLAIWLKIEVGDYSHFITSLHLYESHYKRAQLIVDTNKADIYEKIDLPILPVVPNKEWCINDFIELSRKCNSYMRDINLKEINDHLWEIVGLKRPNPISGFTLLSLYCIIIQYSLQKYEDTKEIRWLERVIVIVSNIKKSYTKITIIDYLIRKWGVKNTDFRLSTEERNLLNYFEEGKNFSYQTSLFKRNKK